MGTGSAGRVAILAWLSVHLCSMEGCGSSAPPFDLPDEVEFSSAHFRYHARASASIPTDILDRLERHWLDLSTFFALNQTRVIDYYLYDDDGDVERHSPCGGVRACADGSAVHAANPFFEHELVHAYLSVLGRAPPIIEEGVASGISCLEISPHRPRRASVLSALTP